MDLRCGVRPYGESCSESNFSSLEGEISGSVS